MEVQVFQLLPNGGFMKSRLDGPDILLATSSALKVGENLDFVRSFIPGFSLDQENYGLSKSGTIPDDLIEWNKPICLACL